MTSGTIVTIDFGPFAGLSGVVVSTSRERIAVRIMLKERAVLVELDADMLQLPVQHGTDLLQRTHPV